MHGHGLILWRRVSSYCASAGLSQKGSCRNAQRLGIYHKAQEAGMQVSGSQQVSPVLKNGTAQWHLPALLFP